MTALVLEIVLLLMSGLTFGRILWVALVVTGISYILGDLVILPATNNAIATVADIGLSIVTIYMFNFFWNRNDIPFISAVVGGVALGVGEILFHMFLKSTADDDDDHMDNDHIDQDMIR
jgi:hypothetical protein